MPVPTAAASEQSAACLWCRSPLAPPRAAPGAWTVVWCGGCGTGNTWPRPTEAELAAAYSSWYRPESGRFSGPGDRVLRRFRARLASRIDERVPGGRVLDVGAGDGTLLDALRARGRDAVGVEPHSARDDVVSGPLDDLEGQWSAVVLWHSLEHLPDPAGSIAAASRSLAPHGLMIVAVPNAASLQAGLFGTRWFALDLPRHLVHLRADSLRRRLQELGLEVERESHVRGGQILFGWLHGLVGLLPGRPSLYDAIRRPEARERRAGGSARVATLAAALLLSPLAAAGCLAEIATRRGGTVYVEARKP